MKEDILNESQNFNDSVYSQNVVQFVAVSNMFCVLAETVSEFEKKSFVEQSIKLLSILYVKALSVEKPLTVEGADVEKFVNEADWTILSNKIAEKLGEHDNYTDVTEPMNPSENLNLSLSECYADIYQDLKDFTSIYKVSGAESINEALWECIDNFEQIWGPRILSLLKELHNIFYGETDFESKKSPEKTESANNKWLDKFFEN
jgi:hypothetical protein